MRTQEISYNKHNSNLEFNFRNQIIIPSNLNISRYIIRVSALKNNNLEILDHFVDLVCLLYSRSFDNIYYFMVH